MNGRILSSAAGLAAVAATACGSAQPPDGATAEPSVLASEEQSERVLAEFDVRGEHHAFLLWGQESDAMLAHRVSGAADQPSPLIALREAAGVPLTTLETFLALAPADLEAPPEIVARQASEAEALGRGSELLELSVDKQLSPPPGRTVCDPRNFFDPLSADPLRWRSQINTGGVDDSYLCTSGTNASTEGTVIGTPDENSCSFLADNTMMAGACTSLDTIAARAGSGHANSWSLTGPVFLAPNQYAFWTLSAEFDEHRMAIVGESEGKTYGFRVGVMSLF